jgi:catechol 2,3-dioxygenase-like lactoylglutathione lyase family enzyme
VTAPLRILGVTLPVPDLATADKFYRWVLAMKTGEEAAPEATRSLGWGKEDRIVLADGEAPGVEEAITLRLPAMTVEGAASWLLERDLTPERAIVPPADEDAVRAAWPGAAIEVATEDALHNRLLLSIRGPFEPRIDLHVALPASVVAVRGSIGPCRWRSEDRSDLEIPGLLGVTTAAPDVAEARAFLARLGIEPIEGDQGPLRVGDHQWVLEERDPAGIYGIAVVLQASRIMDLVRTLEKLEARYRHDANRLLAIDPAGRVLLVHGIKSG